MVRFGYLHLAFLGQESEWAAEASECAGEQGKFWEYHDKLFTSQQGENEGAFAKDKLETLAAGMNLNRDQFNACLESAKYAPVVQAESEMVSGIGVQTTPTFLVNTEPVSGAKSFGVFSQIIERERTNLK